MPSSTVNHLADSVHQCLRRPAFQRVPQKRDHILFGYVHRLQAAGQLFQTGPAGSSRTHRPRIPDGSRFPACDPPPRPVPRRRRNACTGRPFRRFSCVSSGSFRTAQKDPASRGVTAGHGLRSLPQRQGTGRTRRTVCSPSAFWVASTLRRAISLLGVLHDLLFLAGSPFHGRRSRSSPPDALAESSTAPASFSTLAMAS